MAGTLLILVGPSGAGKDSVSRSLAPRAGFRILPGYTSRRMRAGESQGNPYTFVPEEEIHARFANGELFNNLLIDGDRYGLPRTMLREALDRGERIILHLVHEWAIAVKAEIPEAIVVLLLPPSDEEQRRRLILRGELPERVDARQANAAVQRPSREGCDLVVVNETGKLADTVLTIFAALPEPVRGCPPVEGLAAYADHRVDVHEGTPVGAHLIACVDCRRYVWDRRRAARVT